MATLTTDQIAQLCWDNYYATQLTGANAIALYLDQGDYDRHSATRENLIDAFYDDIRDLLHNGNQEDLFGSAYDEDEAEQLALMLHDGWLHDPDPLFEVCESLATLALTTINKED